MSSKSRELILPAECSIRFTEASFSIDFGRSDPSHWCVELAMLLHGISEELVVIDEANSKRVAFFPSADDEPSSGSRMGDTWELYVRSLDVQSLHRFFLEYLHDGVAASEHLEFEFYDPANERSGAATFRVAASVARMSFEEFKRQARIGSSSEPPDGPSKPTLVDHPDATAPQLDDATRLHRAVDALTPWLSERGFDVRWQNSPHSTGCAVDIDSSDSVGTIAHWPETVFEFSFADKRTGRTVVMETREFDNVEDPKLFIQYLLLTRLVE